jgi:N-acetylglutamate synthase-like GNAT family acetyltransferase
MTRIYEISDYRPLIPFFIENELEFEEGEEYAGDEIVKLWRADEIDPSAPSEPGRLVGGCVLAKREGEYICDGIAVASEYRKGGLGKRLLDLLLGEAKARGAGQVFLVARAPGFFAKSGFIPIARDEAPGFFECFSCPQYGNVCRPEVMRFDIR